MLNVTDIALQVVVYHLIRMNPTDQEQVFKLLRKLKDGRVKKKQVIIFQIFELFGLKPGIKKTRV